MGKKKDYYFTATFPNENGKMMVSTNKHSVYDLAGYSNVEWKFPDGSTLPHYDDYDNEIVLELVE